MSDKHREVAMRALHHSKVPADPAGHIRRTTTGDADLSDNDKRIAGARRAATKGKFAGAFQRLCDAVCGATGMAKSLPTHGPMQREATTMRMNDFDPADIVRTLKAGRVSKPMAKSLEAGYNSDSATMTGGDAMRTQSLDKRVQSTIVPIIVKPIGKEQLLKAGALALKAGKLTAAEAMNLEYCANMGRKPDDAIMAKLRGDSK